MNHIWNQKRRKRKRRRDRGRLPDSGAARQPSSYSSGAEAAQAAAQTGKPDDVAAEDNNRKPGTTRVRLLKPRASSLPENQLLAEAASDYQPQGSARQLLAARDPEILICGAAGTGKSRACLEKLHKAAMDYQGCRLLICRKTRESLSESALVTYEEKVLPPDSTVKQGNLRRVRQLYQYPNGSEIVVGGLSVDTRIMSTEFDLIFVQEATELTEEDWEALTTRLRNGVMPYQQLIADCNPSSPQHWLKKRCDRGVTKLLTSTHEDNPRLWDTERQEWTAAGKTYLARLDALTGVRKQRLRYGQWVMAEGMIYADVWNPEIHIIDPFSVPPDWARYWVVDFGYNNPFTWQEWAADGDGRLYRLREIYQTQRLVEDHAKQILAVTWNRGGERSPRPVAIICDHDAEDRATLERYVRLPTIAAHKSVSDGLQAVAGRLRAAADGKPRLYFFRDALVEVDRRLEENKKPTRTEEEIEGYVWDATREKPVKQDDHGLDCVRYLVAYVDFNASEGVYLGQD